MALTRRDFLKTLSIMAVLPSQAGASHSHRPHSTNLFAVSGTVLTGDDTPPLHDHAVIIENGIIHDVIPMAHVGTVPIISPPNTTILPGIINCHVHRIYTPKERRYRYLEQGVTSIGDAASPLTRLQQLTDNPPGRTATAACAGPMLCPPGGYPLPVHSPEHGLVVLSPAHGRERVQELADAGATMVKLAFEPGPYPTPWPQFDRHTASAICDEAQKHDLIVRCHVEDLGGLEPALASGVHVIDHVPHRWIRENTLRDITTGKTKEQILIPYYIKLLHQMVKDKVILAPTLDVLSRSIWNGPNLFLPVRTFADMGGQIAIGNDHPYRRTNAGMPLQEMRLLKKSGLDMSRIIQAGTQVSGRACGFIHRGTIAKGMAADILVTNDNPLHNKETLAAPLHIIKDGVLIK